MIGNTMETTVRDAKTSFVHKTRRQKSKIKGKPQLNR